MGRLIDAGLFLDNLSGRLESMKDYDAVKDVINNMPTAYDPDKVVEQLQKNADKNRGFYKANLNDNAQGQMIAYLHAIEIVKGGGVNGN